MSVKCIDSENYTNVTSRNKALICFMSFSAKSKKTYLHKDINKNVRINQ